MSYSFLKAVLKFAVSFCLNPIESLDLSKFDGSCPERSKFRGSLIEPDGSDVPDLASGSVLVLAVCVDLSKLDGRKMSDADG